MAGLYLHIPFCLSKCHYCDFVSIPSPGEEAMVRYCAALEREIALFAAPEVPSPRTVYLGGGTPTLLPDRLLAGLFDTLRRHLSLKDCVEITVEANPGTVGRKKARLLRDLGVSRVSLGAQSFDDRLLRRLGRPHTSLETRRAIDALREEGPENLGLDLIYGLPGQDVGDWERDLGQALEARPDHLSAYSLTVEDRTPFGRRHRSGRLALPPDGAVVEMYRLSQALLADGGYEHYEISNWARQGGFRCRHNVDCWLGEEYCGAGAGAHGFRRDPSPRRYGNLRDVEAYTSTAGGGSPPREFEENLDGRTLAAELLMLGLRMTEGVEVDRFRDLHGDLPGDLFPEAIHLGVERGWLRESGDRLRFSDEGLLFSDEVFLRLF